MPTQQQLNLEQTIRELIRAGIPSRVAKAVAYQVLSTSVLAFGNEEISDVGTDYLSLYYDPQAQASPTPVPVAIPRGGILRRFRVSHVTPAGNGNDIVYTVRVNGSTTAIVVTLASTGSTAEYSATEIVVCPGDEIDIEVTRAVGVGTAPSDVIATLEFI